MTHKPNKPAKPSRPKSGVVPPAQAQSSVEASVDMWADFRQLTSARIGLARAGASLATRPLLDLRLSHARARDAVHAPLDEAQLCADLCALDLPVLIAESAAKTRAQYLMRPDLGRILADASLLTSNAQKRFDVVFVITEGLSALAMAHAKPLLAEVLPALASEGWRIAPLIVVRLGRVAVGDAVGAAVNADIVVVLIGERPGLSAPDSLGAYLTWRPNARTTDADRNCISNIRPEGIVYAEAAFKLLHLLRAMRARKISGVALKDTTERLLITGRASGRSPLVP
jgi:ethanolamine ammonia-lyase small subunit